ncbi:MAG: hypothetical protein NTAFB01_42130 [Nitrospira sp.]
MRRIEQAVLIGLVLGTLIAGVPGPAKGANQAAPVKAKTQKATKGAQAGPSHARPGRDPVTFSQPTFVDPPKKLLGDSGDGRCPDQTQPCLKDVDDLLFGRTHLLRSDDIVFGYQGAFGLFTSQNSTLTESSDKLFSLNDGTNRYSQPAVVGARLFNSASDVAVTLMYDRNEAFLQWRLDSSTATVGTGTVGIPGYPADDITRFLAVVAGDFTGDGFDEIVVFPKGLLSIAAIVGTAVDPQDGKKGVIFGPRYDLEKHVLPFSITKAVIGGQPRVLVAGPTAFASSCASGLSGLQFESYTIDPKTLTLTSVGIFPANIPEGNKACLQFVHLTPGRFSTATHDQLLVAYGMEGGNVKVIPFDFDAQGNAVPKPIYDTGYGTGGGASFIRGGRFDWSSPVDQAALFISNGFNQPGINTLRILSFDQNFTTKAGPELQAGSKNGECANDMVVGNFDHQQANPGTPPPATIANPNLQIAIPFTDCGQIIALRIFDVDPTTQQISQAPNELNFAPSQSGKGGSSFQSTLATVDLQGRSLRVGPPDIVTIDKHQQATLVLAAPPMHVDAVVPDGDTNPPFAITNITGVPDGLFGGYTFSGTADHKTDTTTGTTWSFGAQETLQRKAFVGSCETGSCLSASAKFTAKQSLEGSKDSLKGTYSGDSKDFDVTTGFTDLVSYQNEAMTIYVYPVIGQTVCPSGNPNCAAGEKVPLTVNMAGPDTLSYIKATPSDVLTWYQPPWIPGNILSYPGNSAQLQAAAFRDATDFQDLSQAETWFIGSSGTASSKVTWTGGGSGGTTTSFKQNYSFDLDLSFTAKVGLKGLAGTTTKGDFDFSGSVGFSSLTDSLTTLSATQGVSFTRTAPLDSTNYGYSITPHIFGKTQPPTVVDDTAAPPPPDTVQTFGALRTGYEVNVSAGSGGGYWRAWYGKAPDVALNQPDHWTVSLQVSDPKDGTCRPFNATTSDVDCVTLGERLPPSLGEPIWLSSFHTMRGLFINGPNGQGPQLQTATTGDQLTLQARVYNLSLAPLPTDALVHVRFMGMLWNTSQNIPAAPSFRIGEQTIAGDQLPPFNSNTQHPNWTLVPQPFDTSGTHCGGQSCDNQDLVFWVVVWIENANGTLGSELQQHGLKSIPANGDDFLAVADREQPYSNNLGFYNQVFHIFPQTPAPPTPTPMASRAQQASTSKKGEIGAQISQAGAAHRTLRRGQSTALAAKVQTGGRNLKGGLEVAFYDGDPLGGGKLIGLQQLPHLSAKGTYDFRVRFAPQQCGKHTVYIVAGAATRHEHKAKLKPIQVKGKNCKYSN